VSERFLREFGDQHLTRRGRVNRGTCPEAGDNGPHLRSVSAVDNNHLVTVKNRQIIALQGLMRHAADVRLDDRFHVDLFERRVPPIKQFHPELEDLPLPILDHNDMLLQCSQDAEERALRNAGLPRNVCEGIPGMGCGKEFEDLHCAVNCRN